MHPSHWLYTLPLRLRSLFHREAAEQDLSDELQYHLEQKTHEYIAGGLSPEEARRKATREFGGLELHKEQCRDTRRVRLIETTLQDIRFGFRMLYKNLGFTAIAILTLGLGIGANTAIFSMVNSFLLRPLPIKDPDQLTVLGMQLKKGALQTSFSYPEFQDLQEQSSSVFSDVIAEQLSEGGLTINGKTEPMIVFYVSGNFFSALSVQPLLGRFILPSEGAITTLNPVIVLGYSFWQTRCGGDPNIIGKTILYNGHPVTVVGIMPKEFHGLYSLADMQGYLPLGMQQVDSSYQPNTPTDRGSRSPLIYARLRQGVMLVQAQSALDVISDRLAKENPKTEEGMTISVFPERLSRPQPDPDRSLLKVDGQVWDYVSGAKWALDRALPPYPFFRGVMTGWDNTPRLPHNGQIFLNAHPANYQRWLAAIVAQARAKPAVEERVVFINAWNEWAEGAYLEPDLYYGRQFLEATRRAVDGS